MTGRPVPAIVIQAERFERCRCPRCLVLDARFPRDGYQLALFPYVRQVRYGLRPAA